MSVSKCQLIIRWKNWTGWKFIRKAINLWIEWKIVYLIESMIQFPLNARIGPICDSTWMFNVLIAFNLYGRVKALNGGGGGGRYDASNFCVFIVSWTVLLESHVKNLSCDSESIVGCMFRGMELSCSLLTVSFLKESLNWTKQLNGEWTSLLETNLVQN